MDAAVVVVSTVVESCPPIRFIPFDLFKAVRSFPRFPDSSNICVNLDDIDVENSLLIFISHCWLRGWSGADGYDGRPHPDNATGGKYELCVDGIGQLMNIYAPGFESCFIWCDFGCIDQNADPAGELKQLDKIVRVCDCLLTVIHDADHASWTSPTTVVSIFDVERSTGWSGNAFAYLSRGWCRVEMFYGSNIPLTDDNEKRRQKMRVGLLHHRSRGRRPHFLYSSKRKAGRQGLTALPPLQNSYFDEYHPVKGNLSVASDKEKIIQLVEDLEPYMRKVVVGLVFDDDSDSDAVTRKGKYTYANGNVYVGEFVNNGPLAYGKLEYASGDVYEGQFIDGNINGHGKLTHSSGSVYEGEWKDDNEHGQGRYTYASGDVYEGQWIDGNRNGHGKYTHADGSVYEGDWKDDSKHGQARYAFANGDVYEGQWIVGKRNGYGKYTYANADIYEGSWKDDKKNGRGQYTHSNKALFDGVWEDDARHGTGRYIYVDGRVTCCEYIKGQLISETPN
jgi:hypothetical protein